MARVKEQNRMGRMMALIREAQEKAGLRRANALLERPENGLTIMEYAKIERIPISTATVQMDKMLDNGGVTEHLVMLPTANGHLKAQRVFVFGSSKKAGKGRAAK